MFEGLGELPGKYHIAIDKNIPPSVQAPSRVPVVLRQPIEKTLQELVPHKVLLLVTDPTQWVSSMLAIVKPNKVRICTDPRDLNHGIRKEHYLLSTIDKVASWCQEIYSQYGFHQILLDHASSFLTTFNSPFGHWVRMFFSTSSAPEIFQRPMHNFMEDLQGFEVITDNFHRWFPKVMQRSMPALKRMNMHFCTNAINGGPQA